MRAHHHLSFFLILLSSFSLSLLPTAKGVNTIQLRAPNESHTRRILHQPLFPENSAPPPVTPPPPPDNPSSPDIPFFNEYPTAGPPPPEQSENQPPPSASNGGTIANPTATQPTKPTKKVAIAASVAFATLGMFSALAFFLYRHRARQPAENHQKLVGGGRNGENSRRVLEDSTMGTPPPPSNFLYIGTVEPNNGTSVTEPTNHSPYHKLSSIDHIHRYRPSPELQPLPPLANPADGIHSPPAASSSSSSSEDNEESRETAFHSPQGSSSFSHEDSYYTPVSRHSYLANGSPTASAPAAPAVPFSKRTSPKSRLSASSPDIRHVMIPSIKHHHAPPPSPPAPPSIQFQHVEEEVTLGRPSRRPKFSSPPPAPNLTHLHSNDSTASLNPPHLPPPPPPPPPPPLPRQNGWSPAVSVSWSSASRKHQQSQSPSGGVDSANSVSVSVSKASEEGDDMEGGKPKLKALHWDKVRATSDRATVWDQLKSSSFQ